MKSLAVWQDESYKVVDIPIPEIDEYSVLCKVLACGICGTDRKIMHGTFKSFDNYPILMGHEALGKVVKLGRKVKNFELGDHIICPYIDDNPEGYFSGLGGMSEYAVAHDEKAIKEELLTNKDVICKDFFQIQKKIPSDITIEDGVMLITLREVLAACKHFKINKTDSIVVFGAGSVGLSFLTILKLLGIHSIISVDIVSDKEKSALEAGADYFFNSTQCDVENEIRNIYPEGVDCVLDAVGINDVINIGLNIIKDDGKIMVYGVSPVQYMNINWEKAPFNWNLEFFQFPNKEEEALATEQIVNWIVNRKLNAEKFISKKFSFDHINDAIDFFISGKSNGKIVVTF